MAKTSAEQLSSTGRTLTRARLPADEIAEIVHRCATELKLMDGATVLITGATGWFGTWLLDVLLAARDLLSIRLEVTGLSRDPEAFLRRNPGFTHSDGLRWLRADVRGLAPSHYVYVIHAATDSGAKASQVNPQDMFETVVHGTGRALKAAGRDCRGFLLFSSGAIYGSNPESAPYREDMLVGPDPASALSNYAESKRAAETLCAIAADQGVPAKISRCFAFIGPHMPFDRHFAIGNFIADAMEGRPIVIRSDGTPTRSYMYMADLVIASLKILIHGQSGRPYNVGSDEPHTIRDVAETVNALLDGKGVRVTGHDSAPDRYLPDIRRLRNELNFAPTTSLPEAISRTAAWYRTQKR